MQEAWPMAAVVVEDNSTPQQKYGRTLTTFTAIFVPICESANSVIGGSMLFYRWNINTLRLLLSDERV
jgi:hypothetical protein